LKGVIYLKKGQSYPKPFYCKECQEPITKMRVLSHGRCLRCYTRKYAKEYQKKYPEKFRKGQKKFYDRYKERGYTTVCNVESVVVCVRCEKHIKGRYSGVGTRVIKCRALKCPHCRYLYRKGDQIEVISVKRKKGRSNSMKTLNKWEIYKHLPDVKEHLESIPEKIETTKELRKKMKLRPLTRKDFKHFNINRDKMVNKTRYRLRSRRRLERKIGKSLRHYGDWL